MSHGQMAGAEAGALRNPHAKKCDVSGSLTVSAMHKHEKGLSLGGAN